MDSATNQSHQQNIYQEACAICSSIEDLNQGLREAMDQDAWSTVNQLLMKRNQATQLLKGLPFDQLDQSLKDNISASLSRFQLEETALLAQMTAYRDGLKEKLAQNRQAQATIQQYKVDQPNAHRRSDTNGLNGIV